MCDDESISIKISLIWFCQTALIWVLLYNYVSYFQHSCVNQVKHMESITIKLKHLIGHPKCVILAWACNTTMFKHLHFSVLKPRARWHDTHLCLLLFPRCDLNSTVSEHDVCTAICTTAAMTAPALQRKQTADTAVLNHFLILETKRLNMPIEA